MLDPDEIEARAEALVGEVLGGRYRLDSVLGIGAMGSVFAGYHTGLKREVAVKLLHKDLMSSDEMRTRFSREAAAISKLDHPNCVRISDYGSDDSYQYLVMELLQGMPLGQELEERIEVMSPDQAMDLADEVLAGLEHAHSHGLVHRDIKPDNIFLAQESDGAIRAKVLDFGIVKLQEQPGQRQLTQVGMVFGTPHFMSPEQAMGSDVDARTDLYAAGAVFYTMLAGRQPFESDDPVKVLRQQIQDAPPPLSEQIPVAIREIVNRLLEKNPDDRFASATEVRQALADARRSLDAPPAVDSTQLTPAPVDSTQLTPAPVDSTQLASAPDGSTLVAPAPSAHAPPGVSEVDTRSPTHPAVAVVSASSSTEPAMQPAQPVPPSVPGQQRAPGSVPEMPGHVHPSPMSGPSHAVGSPALVVPSKSTSPKTGLWVAGGVGLLALVVTIAIAVSGGDEPSADSTSTPSSDAAPGGLAQLLGSDASEPKKDNGDADDAEGEEGGNEPPEPAPEGGEPAPASVDPTLQANLTGIDALIAKKDYSAAQTVLGPLLKAHPNDATLHRRMAQVFTALGGTDNRKSALRSYSKAIGAQVGLLEDGPFMDALMALFKDAALREAAVPVAIDHLGTKADAELLKWLNSPAKPLSYQSRHRVILHLEGHDRGNEISRPLQRALDLWQAQDAEDDVCGTFARTLDDALASPDSYLLGTVLSVPVPKPMVAQKGAQPCPEAEHKLGEVREVYTQMFPGIEPVVPKAFRRRRKRGR